MRRLVKVVAVGYFEIGEDDLDPAFNAKTFEEAVATQARWHEEDPGVPFQEYVSFELPGSLTFELMPEGYDPDGSGA